MNQERASIVRQYVVFHLKLMEVIHLTLLNLHLLEKGQHVENGLGQGIDRFRETLLGGTVTAYMAMSDRPTSTHSRLIWKRLYPRHAKAIDRIWERKILPGEVIMKAYRDQSGAHGDRLGKYLDGKIGLFIESRKVITALDAFYCISKCLLNRQAKEQPELSSDIEAVLLDAELGRPGAFNRRWLREIGLIESGPYTRKF